MANIMICFSQNSLAMLIDLNCEVVKHFAVSWLPAPILHQEICCCRLQARQSLGHVSHMGSRWAPNKSISDMIFYSKSKSYEVYVIQLKTAANVTGRRADSGAPTPLKAELKVHRHLWRRSFSHRTPCFSAILDKNECDQPYASFNEVGPSGWSWLPAKTVVLG